MKEEKASLVGTEGASGQPALRPGGHHRVGSNQRGLYTGEFNKVNLQGSERLPCCRPFFSPFTLSHSTARNAPGGREFLPSVYERILRNAPLFRSWVCFSFEKALQAVISHC